MAYINFWQNSNIVFNIVPTKNRLQPSSSFSSQFFVARNLFCLQIDPSIRVFLRTINSSINHLEFWEQKNTAACQIGGIRRIWKRHKPQYVQFRYCSIISNTFHRSIASSHSTDFAQSCCLPKYAWRRMISTSPFVSFSFHLILWFKIILWIFCGYIYCMEFNKPLKNGCFA